MTFHHQEAHLFAATSPRVRPPFSHLHPNLLRWVLEEQPAAMRLLDVGCGSGRFTLAVAPFVAEVIGVDRDAEALAAGRRQAHAMGLTNVQFIEGDVEVTPYASLLDARPIDMVIANLCMSNAIIEHAHAVLPVGGCLIFAALHTAQWQETGRGSRFAYDAEELDAFLYHNGWQCEAMEVDTEVLHVRHIEDLERYLADSPLQQRWRHDGRWEGLVQYLAGGGERFTLRSHVLVKARKRESG